MYDTSTEPELDVVQLTTMADCLEALRSDLLQTESFAPEAPFREGTIIKLNGEEHLKRRRILNKLVRREAHTRWREDVLVPTLQSYLAELLLNPDADGLVRVDLVPFSMGFFNVMACALTGLDLPTAADRALMLTLIDSLNNGDALRWAPNRDRLIREGLAAMRVFKERFFDPSLQARHELLARLDRGELTEDELPVDMMMLVALKADPAWEDEGNAVRNVMQFMLGASHTNVHPLGYAMDELAEWLKAHPEDLEKRTDPAFLESVINETLRLHTIGPVLWRVAVGDVTFSSGVEIKAGQRVAVGIRQASIDPAAYGLDAAEFNPYRTSRSGAYPYGLAFGSGKHMCQGLPVVVGVEGIDGVLVYVLRAFYQAGARRDDSKQALKVEGFRDSYISYPLVFDSSAVGNEAAALRQSSGTGGHGSGDE